MDDEDLANGQAWWRILTDRDVVRRRIEVIRFESAVLRERKISLDVSMRNVWRCYGMSPDSSVAIRPNLLRVPLLFQPKSLIFDFDLLVNGRHAPVEARFDDASLATTILVALGYEDTCGQRAPAGAQEFLRELCLGLPSEPPEASLADRVMQFGLASVLESDAVGLDDSSRAWLLVASNSRRWVALAERLASEYLVVASLPASRDDACLVKLRRLESRADSDAPDFAEEVEPPATPVTVRIFGAGRARSEHFRVVAPSGMFFAAGYLFPVDDAPLFRYYDQQAFDRLVFYTNSAPDGELVVSASLYPVRRDFVTPARILTVVGFGILLAGTISGFGNNELEKLSGAVEALAALSLFTPSAVLAYLLKPDDHEIKWIALRTWRRWAFSALLPLGVAVATLLPKASDWAHGVLTWIWAGLTFVSGIITIMMLWLTREIAIAERAAIRSEGLRTEWGVTTD